MIRYYWAKAKSAQKESLCRKEGAEALNSMGFVVLPASRRDAPPYEFSWRRKGIRVFQGRWQRPQDRRRDRVTIKNPCGGTEPVLPLPLEAAATYPQGSERLTPYQYVKEPRPFRQSGSYRPPAIWVLGCIIGPSAKKSGAYKIKATVLSSQQQPFAGPLPCPYLIN